jgi:hypothetical protein
LKTKIVGNRYLYAAYRLKFITRSVEKISSARSDPTQESQDKYRISQASQACHGYRPESRATLTGEIRGQRSHFVWLSSPTWRFYPFSDIDLAVRGIVPDRFFEAVGLVTGLSAEFKIDLVEIETSSPGMYRSIQKDGKPL